VKKAEQQEKPTLLAVLAHPDDETFGVGGTLALYARRDVAVHLICATRGESGEADQEFLEGHESMADMRVSELQCAAEVLDLNGLHFLDYRDSGMQGSPDNQHPRSLVSAPLEDVATKIAEKIRLIRPQVMITFDPVGSYKHPDHVAVHLATVKAFDLAADPTFLCEYPPYQPQKLYFQVIPRTLLRIAARVLPLFGQNPRQLGRNKDIDIVSLVEEDDSPIHAKINYRRVAGIKDTAITCHASQIEGGLVRGAPVYWLLRWFASNDNFTRAYPEPESRLREKDLFAGIEFH